MNFLVNLLLICIYACKIINDKWEFEGLPKIEKTVYIFMIFKGRVIKVIDLSYKSNGNNLFKRYLQSNN